MSTVAYRAKHCTQVAISGMSFLDCAKSEACSKTIWPSIPWVRDDKGLLKPLAGGSSPRSMYAPDSMSSIVVLFKGGAPGATDITLLVDGTTLVTTDMSGFAIAVVVWLLD